MAASRPLIEGKDFSVCFRIGPDPSVAVISFHSGAGEHGALEIADALAQELGCSLYIFENTMGVYADTHTTSNNFDDPRAVAAVEYAQVAVAMHGAANRSDFPAMCTFVGGTNKYLRMAFIRRLREDGRFGAVDAVLDSLFWRDLEKQESRIAPSSEEYNAKWIQIYVMPFSRREITTNRAVDNFRPLERPMLRFLQRRLGRYWDETVNR